MNYQLITTLEERILGEMKRHPNTTHGFLSAVESALSCSSDILADWKRHLCGPLERLERPENAEDSWHGEAGIWKPWKGKSWKGIEQAARNMALWASYDSEILKIAKEEELLAAANAIYAAVAKIYGPVQKDRSSGEKWLEIDFCALCWRLVPAGGSTILRPPLCVHHQTRTAGYQKHKALIPSWSEDIIISDDSAITIWAETMRTVKAGLASVGGPQNITAKLSPEILKSLPTLNGYLVAAGVETSDLREILLHLLLDEGTPDSPDSIIFYTAEKWAKSAGVYISKKKLILKKRALLAAEVLLRAEAWLFLLNARPNSHGGRRPGAGRKRKK